MTVTGRPIRANPGLNFCSVFVLYLPTYCLEYHFVLSLLYLGVKARQYFVSSSCMFLEEKTLLKIWRNLGINFRGTGPWAFTVFFSSFKVILAIQLFRFWTIVCFCDCVFSIMATRETNQRNRYNYFPVKWGWKREFLKFIFGRTGETRHPEMSLTSWEAFCGWLDRTFREFWHDRKEKAAVVQNSPLI